MILITAFNEILLVVQELVPKYSKYGSIDALGCTQQTRTRRTNTCSAALFGDDGSCYCEIWQQLDEEMNFDTVIQACAVALIDD